MGRTYCNINASTTFIKYITTAKDQVAEEIKKVKFLSITLDGATDASITDQEIVFVHYSHKGKPVTKFAGLRQPVSQDATGLFQAIMEALEVGLNESWRRNWWGLVVILSNATNSRDVHHF